MKSLVGLIFGKNAFDRTLTALTFILSFAAVGLLQWQWNRFSTTLENTSSVTITAIAGSSGDVSQVPVRAVGVAAHQLIRVLYR